ncbi:MAG: putative LPS assembly protein LptD [Arachidicoccus sp.]|nr:putative LPS assembly protein LptD [Arachidicoccus sp.]
MMIKPDRTKIISVLPALSVFVILVLFSSRLNAQVVDSGKTNRLLFPIVHTDTILYTIPAYWADNLEYRTPNDALVHKRVPTIDASFLSKDSITSITDYKATSASVFMIKENKFYLYKDAEIKNTQADITADTIEFNKNTNIVKAYGAKDSTSIYGRPTIVQNGSKTILDTGYFNVKTQKGIFKNSFYNEGEIYVQANVAKKVDSNSIFIKDARFTTCNLEPPHFDLHAWKLKMITGKLAVSGPAIPEFEGVPMPVIIPFGIYPLTRGRHSGLLPPVFQQDNIKGLGVTGLGYYKVINDNWDVTTRVDLFSYGGYTINISPEYYERYKYRGNLMISYMLSKMQNTSSIMEDEYTTNRSYQINWSHSTDAKAHPGVNFSASVNYGSTRYNKLQTLNPYQNVQNTMTSTINYSKSWKDGKYNLAVGTSASENTLNHLVNLTLPNLSFNTATFNPFQKKESAGNPKWYENISIGYNGTFQNTLGFYDTAKNSLKRLMDTMQWGATHSIPITITLPSLGPFIFTPSVSYQQNWYGYSGKLNWDEEKQKVDTALHKGFYAAQQMSFGISMNTRIFGTFNFKNGKIAAIRHELRPSIGFSYTPAMNGGSWDSVQIAPSQIVSRGVFYRPKTYYSKYQVGPGNLAGAFSNIPSGAITFSLNNILQMKVRNDKDTTGSNDSAYKKVNLIDGFSINTSYNLLADSCQWAPVSINFNTSLFSNKLSLNSSMSVDQYEYNKYGQKTRTLLWTEGKLGAITNGSLSLSTSFSSKKTQSQSDSDRIAMNPDPNMPLDQQMAQMNYVRSNPGEFVDFDIPWNVQLSYSMSFNRVLNPDYSGFHQQFSSSLNVNGDFSLSPKWKAGGSFYYDVIHRKVGMMTLFLSRDMHCWQMSINITPIGYYKSFSIVLNPKSGILRDLKINRTRSFYSSSY